MDVLSERITLCALSHFTSGKETTVRGDYKILVEIMLRQSQLAQAKCKFSSLGVMIS